mmetsp:Transcript_14232/g.28397  ORF Transcript_14232/g.28397 Transcript_14232/m.28397 type:complete len:370 (-) Transcript_14232:369-1478(-)
MIIAHAASEVNYNEPDTFSKYDNDGDVLISLRPAFGTHSRSSDAIFALAEGYDAKSYHRFIATAREAGYKGDIVLSVSTPDKLKKDVLKYLEGAAAKGGVIVYHVPWTCNKISGEKADSALDGVARCNNNGLFGSRKYGESLKDMRTGRPVATARYELYWAWNQMYDTDSRIMLVDFRDTIFQDNPFRDLARTTKGVKKGEGALHLYLENYEATGIFRSSFNKNWIQSAYGKGKLKEIGDQPVICSGSTVGEQVALDVYLRAMVAEYDRTQCKAKGCDQGFHNYLFRKQILDEAKGISKIILHEQGKGAINNLAAMRTKTLKEWGILKDGKVYNWDGTLSPVVHQYDRDKDLANFVRKRASDLWASETK